jgi:serine/threonine protein kinase
VLPQAMAGDHERRAALRTRSQSVAALNHPNIITIHSVESAGDLLFLTMELVDGKTLEDVVPREWIGDSIRSSSSPSR